MDLSERLKNMRTSANITQNELSKRIYDTYGIKISQGNIGDWERGRSKPSADALIALSKYYNVTTDYILTGIQIQTNISTSYDNLSSNEQYVVEKMRLLPPTKCSELIGYLNCLCENLVPNGEIKKQA